MKNVMVDIETMGTSSNSAMISIGAVYFDETGLGREFYKKINLESSMIHGKVDASTIMWWLQQSDNARAEFKDNEFQPSLERVLTEFSLFLDPGITLWGYGEDFDNVILRNAYRSTKLNIPWNEDACLRKLKKAHPDIYLDPIPEDKIHHALEDAKWQAGWVIKLHKDKNLPWT